VTGSRKDSSLRKRFTFRCLPELGLFFKRPRVEIHPSIPFLSVLSAHSPRTKFLPVSGHPVVSRDVHLSTVY